MKSYWYKLGLMGMNKLMKRKGKKTKTRGHLFST